MNASIRLVEKSAIVVSLDPHGRVLMTRDMELIRKIIVAIRAREDAGLGSIDIPDTDPAILARHLELLIKAGLLEGEISWAYNAPYPKVLVKDLTWEGHDFASAVSDDQVWAKIKNKFSPSQLAGMTLGIIKEIGVSLLTELAKAQAGLT